MIIKIYNVWNVRDENNAVRWLPAAFPLRRYFTGNSSSTLTMLRKQAINNTHLAPFRVDNTEPDLYQTSQATKELQLLRKLTSFHTTECNGNKAAD